MKIKEIIQQQEEVVGQIVSYFDSADAETIRHKTDSKSWSAKETLGHLIDSAVQNLKRIAEAPTDEQVYCIDAYDQEALVVTNQYQQQEISHLLPLFQLLNKQISIVVSALTDEQLQHAVMLADGEIVDLRFIIEDYVAHIQHHTKAFPSLEAVK